MARLPSRRTSATAPQQAPRPADCALQVMAVVPAVMDALRGAMRGHIGESGGDQLSVPQFRCLNFIAGEPGASVSAVAAFLGVTMPTASAMVDRLVRAGSVAPTTAPEDRRRSQLHLTEAGRALLKQIRIGAHADLARALASRSADELKSLQDGLAVLQQAFAPDRAEH